MPRDESVTETSDTERDAELSKMERDRRKHNQRVRSRDECRVCEDPVPDDDFKHKFAAAGGCLTGPFCSADCYWRWFNS